MHYQYCDDDEEFEPRITPKPIMKPDYLAVPSIPEISLIFEKPAVRNQSDAEMKSSSARLEKPPQLFDDIPKCIDSTSPIDNHNSYAAWRERNYSRENNFVNTTHASCKNASDCNHASQSTLQNTSMQKQKQPKQDKIYDMQNRLINARSNGGIYEKSVKFRCPNVDNSYNLEQLSSDNRHLLSYNSLQRHSINDHMRVHDNAFIDTLKINEHLKVPYTGYPYSIHPFYPPSYPNRDIDNNETVRTLLQLVNNQSEQIKTLQSQVDRLVRMQEESFKSKSTCSCSVSFANQGFGYQSINCYDPTDTLGSSRAQSHNHYAKKNTSQNTSITEKKNLENVGGNKDSKMEVALLEQQSKKTFMEQKVSIGVMTSFEFTVQNSPFLMDSEIYEKKEAHEENDNINRKNAVNMHDTTESVKRYKNTFTCKPGMAQLENIVEDTESYLSSSQQQSSNFNTNSSMRDSERHTPKQSDLYYKGGTNIPGESAKMHRRFAADLNQRKMHEEVYIRKSGTIDEQMQNTRKTSNASTSASCSSARSANCNKAFVNDTKNCIMMDEEKSDGEKTNATRHSLRNVHLPSTNYNQNHRNTEHNTNVKQIKNVGDSIILSGGDLKILERPPPTPEPSIHVEMQEYTSDDESDKLKRTPKIGWTFYNNVLGQVNEILQNSDFINDKDKNDAKIIHKVEQEDSIENRTALNTVKAATLEQLRKLGISLTENNEHKESNGNNKILDFDTSFYPRLDCQANMMHTTSVVNETNTSMHMKALASKYLSDEQLADIALHKQGSSSLKHLMLSNMQGTNMSFATMRYLERYQLIPGRNNVQIEDTNQIYDEIAPKHNLKPVNGKNNPVIHQFPFVQTPGTTCPSRILDISALKRQPKLL